MTGQQTELPEWMRNPGAQARITLRWRFSRWMQRRRWWRAVAGVYWRWADRTRFSERFPKTAGVLGWILAFAITMALVTVVYYLYSKLLSHPDIPGTGPSPAPGGE
ncbi:hypothetical protein [Catellatospora sp. TT07R-123]|uniref:hypothetical protein n=1 Tax=Catellatospora sp. TT07R-123 TaxID=2733863 RepID=UPI001BB3C68C|nr:hypothetical protein [Catellatospora sp. TT07R-123]